MSPPAPLKVPDAVFLLGLLFEPENIIEATYSPETSVELRRIALLYISEGETAQA